MDRQNLVPILITILAAALLTYFIILWTDRAKSKPVLETTKPIFANELQILTAAENLLLGRKLQKTDLIWKPWPKETISNNYIIKHTRKLDNFIGMVVRKPANKGDPILDENIIQPAQRNALAAIIKPGKRALSIEVNEVTGVGGFIFPGDYIDIIASSAPNNNNENNIAIATIVKDVLVLAVDQTTSRDASDIAKIVKTVTVEIEPKQAELITKAQASGQISLTLQGLIQ